MSCSSLDDGGSISGGERGFVWPPRGLGSEVATCDADGERADLRPGVAIGPKRGFRTRVSDAMWAVEREWLVPTASPLARRMESSGWRPDAPGVYCDRCGETCGPYETSEFGCAACHGKHLGWDRFVRLGAHEDCLREWVHEVKFERGARLGYELGRRLGVSLRAAGVLECGRVCVTPVPAHWSRRVTRGVDHAGVIALGVASELRAPVVQALRRRWGRSQRSAPAGGRGRNVSRAYAARGRVRGLGGMTVILVDDVRTTGATLRACVRALRGGSGGAVFAGVWAGVVGVASHGPARQEAGLGVVDGGLGA